MWLKPKHGNLKENQQISKYKSGNKHQLSKEVGSCKSKTATEIEATKMKNLIQKANKKKEK